MSESEIAIRPGVGGDGISIPPVPEGSASDTAVGASWVTSNARRVGTLLRWAVSFPAMLGTFLIGAVFYLGRGFRVDPDLWWHIKTGENILATHHWPTTDPYSYTVGGTPWLAYEWMGDVLFGAVDRAAGLQGLVALLIVLGSAVVIAIYSYVTLRSGNSKAGFVASAILFTLACASFNLRPQMLGYLYILLTLIVLEKFRQGKRRALWFLPPLFLLWINSHGSWIIGLGIVFVFLASGLKEFRLGSIEARQWSPADRLRLEFVFLLCLAAIPFTPYGTETAAYPFEVASKLPQGVANVAEWQPMPFNILQGKIFLALILGFFVAQMALRFTCRLEELALFLGGTVMACLHLRFILLFVPFVAALLVAVIARWIPPYEKAKDRYILNAVVMAVVFVAMFRYFPTRAEVQQIVGKSFPSRAVEYLRQHPLDGRIYNTYGYGGYLIWALPEKKVFVDGRSDPYERAGALSDYLEIANLRPAAFALLQSYNIQACLLDRNDALATVLAHNADWRQEYSDGVSMLFVRSNNSVLPAPQPEPATVALKE
jgi:hypothetical protein